MDQDETQQVSQDTRLCKNIHQQVWIQLSPFQKLPQQN